MFFLLQIYVIYLNYATFLDYNPEKLCFFGIIILKSHTFSGYATDAAIANSNITAKILNIDFTMVGIPNI